MAPTESETPMIYRRLGNTGLQVSALSFGSWVTFGSGGVQVKNAKELMHVAYDRFGVNFFDNAETYDGGRAEEVMGQAFKELVQEKGWTRESVVFSTKLFFGTGKLKGPNARGLSRKHIVEGMKASLKRLDMEYVDLVFCHRPDDAITPMEEVVRGMNFVIEQGWAFYWGTSEWTAQQITEACEIAKRLNLIPPAFDQPEYNMFTREKVESEYLPLYRNYGWGLTIWSPLASGVLSGKYSKGHVPEGSRLANEKYKGIKESKLVDNILNKVDALKPIADELGCTLAQLALAWCVSNEHVSTTITGATKMEQLEDNLKSLAYVSKITPEIRERIDKVMESKPEPPKTYLGRAGEWQ